MPQICALSLCLVFCYSTWAQQNITCSDDNKACLILPKEKQKKQKKLYWSESLLLTSDLFPEGFMIAHLEESLNSQDTNRFALYTNNSVHLITDKITSVNHYYQRNFLQQLKNKEKKLITSGVK